MLRLYDYFRSSASFRVRIALHYKKCDFETVPIHLLNNGGEHLSKAYQTINPQSLVPSLETPAGILTQSLAIIEYLEETHPTPALLPKTAFEKARTRQLSQLIACDIHPLNNLRVLQYCDFKDDAQKSQWYHHWVRQGFDAYETLAHADGPFSLGEQFSMADVCLIPQVYNALRLEFVLEDYPKIQAIYKAAKSLTAVNLAWP